jgi:hypothetical protein
MSNLSITRKKGVRNNKGRPDHQKQTAWREPSYPKEETDADIDGLIDLSTEMKLRLYGFIQSTILPSTRSNPCNSYALKHTFEGRFNTYITNGVFKAAMLVLGHMPTRPKRLDWRYKIRLKLPVKFNE